MPHKVAASARKGARPRVFVLDDDEVGRGALVRELGTGPTIEIVGEGLATFNMIPQLNHVSINVVLLDVHPPGVAGVELCREIRTRRPEVDCVVMTSRAEETYLADAIIAGAAGYVLRGEPTTVIAETISTVARGRAVVDPSLGRRVLHRMNTKTPFDKLSVQERRVAGRVAEGWSNKEIADELCLSVQTVKNYVHRILTKLELGRRTQIVVLAAGQNRLDLGDH